MVVVKGSVCNGWTGNLGGIVTAAFSATTCTTVELDALPAVVVVVLHKVYTKDHEGRSNDEGHMDVKTSLSCRPSSA